MASQFQHFTKGICKAELDLERQKKKVCIGIDSIIPNQQVLSVLQYGIRIATTHIQ